MKHHLNTLFVTTHGAYLSKDGESIAVKIDGTIAMRIPLHNIGSVVCFGGVGCSPALMGACARAGIALSFLTSGGKFLAKVSGFTPGNVLLRREQYRWADDPARYAEVARTIILAKIANMRSVLQRAIRDHGDSHSSSRLKDAVTRMSQSLEDVFRETDLDSLRGLEGDASRSYFAVFNDLITNPDKAFAFHGRSKRPPRDITNSLMSFLYTMLSLDARAACETVGLDAAVGFLHRDRPGRPGLALDLMEEMRAYLADRLTLSLINRQQVKPGNFEVDEGGGVTMSEETRKAVLQAYQKRKQETITHPFILEKTTVGLILHLQARLLARFIRGELDAYPAFVAK